MLSQYCQFCIRKEMERGKKCFEHLLSPLGDPLLSTFIHSQDTVLVNFKFLLLIRVAAEIASAAKRAVPSRAWNWRQRWRQAE